MIVIENPTPPAPQAKLIETVMQVIPADSQTNKLLRFGSRGWPKSKAQGNGDRRKYRNSFCTMRDYGSTDSTFQTKATVHRTMS